LPIRVHSDCWICFLVNRFSFTIAYVDPNSAGKRTGEINTQQFSWHWPRDDESILLIVISMVVTISMSLLNAAIGSLSDPSWTFAEVWGCREELNGDSGPYSRNVTSIFDYNTAAE
jgi:hypothetical protein